MGLGTTLAQATIMLKSQIGASLSVGTADDTLYYQKIETKQQWFASMYDWDMLVDSWDATVPVGTSNNSPGRFNSFPTTDIYGTANTINFDRALDAAVLYSLKWCDMGFGIGTDEMNLWNSDLGQTSNPCMKWDFKKGDRTYFEVWPLGGQVQTVRFTGQRNIATLRTAGVLDTTKTLTLDDRLVTLAVAVDLLSGMEDQSAKPTAEMLAALWRTLRGAEPKNKRAFGLYTRVDQPIRRVVPITTV